MKQIKYMFIKKKERKKKLKKNEIIHCESLRNLIRRELKKK